MLTHPEKAQPAHDAAFVLKEWTLAFSICHVDAKLSCLGGQRVLEVPMEGALPQLRGTEVPRRNSIPKNKAPKSQDGHTVRLLHQKEGEKGDVLGYLGLKVALSVPDRERLDWELIILDASRATQLGPSHVKLRRGDRILRVEEVSELREMIASLAALDTRGAEEPEEVELLVDLRTLREADKALESALPLSCKGFNLNPEFPDCGSEASLLGLPSYTEKSQSLVTFEGTDQLMMTRLRRVIRDLNVQEASQVVEKLTKRPQPSLLAFSPADAAADAVEFEVERLSETLLGAAGLSGSGGGGRDLWNALVAGSRGALAEAVDEAGATEDFAMPLDGLWLEALYNVGAIALELRREEIQFYTDAWCTRTIEMDWHRQLDEIDETLGWVSQQVEHLKAKAQQVLVMRRLEGGSESLTVQQSFPPPSVLSLRWAMLKKPARDMVRELHRMRPRQKAKLALPADLKTGVKKVQHRHVGEAKPVEADGSCSHHLLVRDGNSSDCILPQRIDVGKHFIMTGGPEAIREPYEDMISRVSSFGRYLFDLKELPVVEKLFENPKFLHFAKSVCPKEKQVLD
eukprot:s33_g35.t1